MFAPIQEDEWSRFQQYAGRVRELHHHEVNDKIDRSAFDALFLRNGGKPLLPALEGLDWRQSSPHGAEMLSFMPESLRRLRFFLTSRNGGSEIPRKRDYNFGTALWLVATRVPTLGVLEVRGVEHPCSLSSLAEFKHLCTLSLGTIPSISVVLQSCAAMEHLQSLSFFLHPNRSNELVGTFRTGFRALRSLSMSGTSSDTTSMLAAIRSPHLYSVVMMITLEVRDLEGWRRCYQTLGSRFASSLRTLEITCLPPVWQVIGDEIVPLQENIEALLTLHKLEKLYLAIDDIYVSLTDDDFLKIATAWPELSSLTIYVRQSDSVPPPSIHSLKIIAEHCPRLKTLTLPRLNVSDLSELEIEASPPMMSHKLQNLSIADLELTDREGARLVRFLDSIFPYLSKDAVVSVLQRRRGMEQVLSPLSHRGSGRDASI
ncbi:hypothetical protein A0H81_03136 [Grifola frondosa]|uniref:F-box domain-containing protein n=1 Tax=Grifola frondosa TaxID=5627 RepID=A0A1C7MGX6_GRIFR|nr:hypothetical protein A0H81_03136 [Grifola frondosa]